MTDHHPDPHRSAVRPRGKPTARRRLHLASRAFWRDEVGATTVEFVVVTAMVVGLAVAVTAAIATGAQQGAERIEKCMEIQGKLLQKDLSYEQQLKRMQKRCAKI